MTGNEYLALDYTNLAKKVQQAEQDIRTTNEERQRVREALQVELTEPKSILAQVNSDITTKKLVLDALNAEIGTRVEALNRVKDVESRNTQSLSDATKKHQQNASNALLRQHVAEEALEKVKKERELHDKATTVALEARKQSQEASMEAERQRIRCQLETKAATEERDLMLQEVEETRILLERYRADKLNLEKWEEKLNNKEMFLEEVARQLGVTEVTS